MSATERKPDDSICIKKLDLVTPAYARENLGLLVNRPIFYSRFDSQPFSYEVGKKYRVEGFFDPEDTGETLNFREIGKIKRQTYDVLTSRPRVGLAYQETVARVAEEFGQFVLVAGAVEVVVMFL